MATRHSKAAKMFQKNREKAEWQDNTLWGVRVKRDRMAKSLDEWETLRDMASAIKRHTVTNLDVYLEQFAENADQRRPHHRKRITVKRPDGEHQPRRRHDAHHYIANA